MYVVSWRTNCLIFGPFETAEIAKAFLKCRSKVLPAPADEYQVHPVITVKVFEPSRTYTFEVSPGFAE